MYSATGSRETLVFIFIDLERFQKVTKTLGDSSFLMRNQVSGSLPFLENLTQLEKLDLSDTQVSGSLFLLQNLTQIEKLDLSDTQVGGSTTTLPQLTGLVLLWIEGSQVGVPTEQELAGFTQQHPKCITRRNIRHEVCFLMVPFSPSVAYRGAVPVCVCVCVCSRRPR